MTGLKGSLWSIVASIDDNACFAQAKSALDCAEWLLTGYEDQNYCVKVQSDAGLNLVSAAPLGMFATSQSLIKEITAKVYGAETVQASAVEVISLWIFSAGYLAYKNPLLKLWSDQLTVLRSCASTGMNAAGMNANAMNAESVKRLEALYSAFSQSCNFEDFIQICSPMLDLYPEMRICSVVLAAEFWGIPEQSLLQVKQRTQSSAPALYDRVDSLDKRFNAYLKTFKEVRQR